MPLPAGRENFRQDPVRRPNSNGDLHVTFQAPLALSAFRARNPAKHDRLVVHRARHAEAIRLSPAPYAITTLFFIAGILELAGGILVLLGLFTRPVAFLLSGEMAIAYFMVHMPIDFFPANNQGDGAILFCFVFLFLVFSGPGNWALDNRRR